MADVASLLLEIETAQKKQDSRQNTSSSFLGSLFDKDDDDDDVAISPHKSTSNGFNPDLSLSVIGKACKIHPSNAQSIQNGAITDPHDARHKLSKFEMNDIINTQQRLKANKSIHSSQWQEDKDWHLRNEKNELMKENTRCTIRELEHERYKDLAAKSMKTGKPDRMLNSCQLLFAALID